jgi:hypothetical protein
MLSSLAAQRRAEPLGTLPNLRLIDCGIAKQQTAAIQRFQRIGRERGGIDAC